MQSVTDNELAYHNLRGYWVVFLVSALVGYKIASAYAASMASIEEEDSITIDKQQEKLANNTTEGEETKPENEEPENEEKDHTPFVSPL